MVDIAVPQIPNCDTKYGQEDRDTIFPKQNKTTEITTYKSVEATAQIGDHSNVPEYSDSTDRNHSSLAGLSVQFTAVVAVTVWTGPGRNLVVDPDLKQSTIDPPKARASGKYGNPSRAVRGQFPRKAQP